VKPAQVVGELMKRRGELLGEVEAIDRAIDETREIERVSAQRDRFEKTWTSYVEALEKLELASERVTRARRDNRGSHAFRTARTARKDIHRLHDRLVRDFDMKLDSVF
jgi:hypothetical protein